MDWYGMVWYGTDWYGMVCYGLVWYDMVCYGLVWYDMVWYGLVWYGIGLEETIIKEIEQNQLTCYGHVQRMAEGRL